MNFPSDENLQEIGRVCVAFSELERNHAILLEILADVPWTTGAIIASQLSFPKMLDVTNALFLHHVPESSLKSEFDKMLKQSGDAEAQRNSIIHSYYFVDDTSPTRELIRTKNTARRGQGLRQQRQIIEPAVLRKLSDDLAAAAEEVAKFILTLLPILTEKMELAKNSEPTTGPHPSVNHLGPSANDVHS